jgi:hypothetical protein
VGRVPFVLISLIINNKYFSVNLFLVRDHNAMMVYWSQLALASGYQSTNLVTEEKYKLTETVVYGLHGYTAVLCKNTVLNYFFTPGCDYTINLDIAAKIRPNAGDAAAIAFL